jgi:hypothetical protein
MPRVNFPELLHAVYDEALRLIEQRQIPTELIPASAVLFHYLDLQYATINTQVVFPRQSANEALIIRNQFSNEHRFSGQSSPTGVTAYGGLYCSLQQQAIVNEISHYARTIPGVPRGQRNNPNNWNIAPPDNTFPDVDAALRGKCIVRIRLMSSVLAADISTHNPGSAAFLEALGRTDAVQKALRACGGTGLPLAHRISDSEDCSAARGIGLAVANTPWLKALKVTTARDSDRSSEEKGDNLIFFGNNGIQVPRLWIDQAYFFPLRGGPIICPVEFAPNT